MPFSTPILFIIFNRPDTTQQVFNAIRQAKPKHLFVAADGPRCNHAGEAEKCETVRAIVRQVDWDCEVKTLFRDENLGCGRAVSSAITWFFDHVEEGIILEDDCLPHPSFFSYCQELLEYYRHNDMVMLISGNQLAHNPILIDDSYYFSAFSHIWGWATWRTTWQKYKFSVKDISQLFFWRCLKQYFSNKSIRRYWFWMYNMMRLKPIDTWDYQLVFSIWANKGLTILPQKNLVSNIGFGEVATHTFNELDKNANIPTFEIGVLKHPTVFVQNKQIDETYSLNDGNVLTWVKYAYHLFRLCGRKVYEYIIRK